MIYTYITICTADVGAWGVDMFHVNDSTKVQNPQQIYNLMLANYNFESNDSETTAITLHQSACITGLNRRNHNNAYIAHNCTICSGITCARS